MTIELPAELAEFEPCIVVNEEAGLTIAVFEDVAYYAKPLFPDLPHWIDELRAMDDDRLIGVQLWMTMPPQLTADGELTGGSK